MQSSIITVMTTIHVIFGLLSIAFGYPVGVPQGTTGFEHEPTPTSDGSPPSPTRTETTGASLSHHTETTMIGLLFLFILGLVALTCFAYNKRIREYWARRWRGRPWGGTGTGIGPPGTLTGGYPPFSQYQPIAPPSPAHIVNANGNNEPVQLKVLQPAPLGVATGFGRK